MKTVHVCQWCKKKAYEVLKAPSFVMGTSMFEQLVCQGCHDKARNHAEEHWCNRKHDHRASDCCGCGCSMKQGQLFHAPHSSDDKGNWTLKTVCKNCFSEFTSSFEQCRKGCCG